MDFYGSVALETLHQRIVENKDKVENEVTEGKLKFIKPKHLHNMIKNNNLKVTPLKDYQTEYAVYIYNKHQFIKHKTNMFYTTLEEGNEDSDEVFYNLIFDWIMSSFAAAESYKGARGHQNYLGTHKTVEVTILKNPELLSWITVLNNLLVLKPACKEIFFSRYFEKDWDYLKNYAHLDKLERKKLNIKKVTYDEKR